LEAVEGVGDQEYGGMLPARVVLEHNPADQSYRTFLETITGDGETRLRHGQYFYHEDDALADFNLRLGRLCPRLSG
jgi:hypothetical protein